VCFSCKRIFLKTRFQAFEINKKIRDRLVGELIAKVPETFSVEANGYVGLQLRKKYKVAKSLGLTGYL
jgi:hypothetical protein